MMRRGWMNLSSSLKGVFAAGVMVAVAACGRTAETPVAPTNNAVTAETPDVAPTPPEPEAPKPSWLAWRQDAGGVGITALITAKTADGSGEDADIVFVAKELLVYGGGDVWSFGPATERWPLKPCDEDGIGVAKSLRYQKLNLGVEGGLAGDIGLHAWSTGGRRPGPNDSAMHNEYLAFRAQVGNYLYLKHVTTSDTCPVPAGGSTEIDHWVFDMAAGKLVAPTDLLTAAEKVAIETEFMPGTVAEIKARRKELGEDLSADAIRAAIALQGLVFGWTEAGQLEVSYEIGGTSNIFASDLVDPDNRTPGAESHQFKATKLPGSLGVDAVPAAVLAFWKKGWADDKGRSVGFEEAGLYGGVGFAAVPPELAEKLRKEIGTRRNAPTPDGPGDWD